MSRAFFRTLSLSLLCALPLSGALGQATEDKTYTGTWSVRLQAPDGVARDATLVIDGYEGTWQRGADAGFFVVAVGSTARRR